MHWASILTALFLAWVSAYSLSITIHYLLILEYFSLNIPYVVIRMYHGTVFYNHTFKYDIPYLQQENSQIMGQQQRKETLPEANSNFKFSQISF